MSDLKCLACGERISGQGFYCEGCSNYLCWSCAVADGDIHRCPNCGNEVSQISM